MATVAPNLKQLAVLDWLRRWPGVFLNARGSWNAAWESEASRLHMMAIVSHLGAPTDPGEGGKEGWGTFDGTPHCGSATFKALDSRGWLEQRETSYNRPYFGLSEGGRAVLLQFCFRLKGYQPRTASQRASRPVQPSAKLLKRYGGPDGARRYLEFHEKQAAYHSRIAFRLKESLDLYEGSPEQRADEWAARGRRRVR